MSVALLRPVRNNNPGDLDAGDHWQGLMPTAQLTPAQAAEPRFAVFKAPKWGFRALAVVLRNYQHLHGLNTIAEIITRLAPPEENDTAAYIKAVSLELGINADVAIDLENSQLLTALSRAIARHEAGGWFFQDADLAAGVAMAEAA